MNLFLALALATSAQDETRDDRQEAETVEFGAERFTGELRGKRHRTATCEIPCQISIDGQLAHEADLGYRETVTLQVEKTTEGWKILYEEDSRLPSLKGREYLALRREGSLISPDTPRSEVETLREDCGDLGEVHPLSALLPTGPIPLGQTLDIPGPIATQLFRTHDLTITESKAKLVGRESVGDRECARFEIKVRAESTLLRPKTTLELDGSLLLALDNGAPVHASLAGPAKIQGRWADANGAEIHVSGTGTAELELRWD